MNSNIFLYCNCFREKINLRTEYNQQNLMLGSIGYTTNERQSLRQKRFLLDDVGKNISYLNPIFGQLTGLYWTWKNTNHEITGTSVYRIFWGDFFKNHQFKKNTLYVPNAIPIKQGLRQKEITINNVFDQYGYCHDYTNWNLLYDLIKNKKTIIKKNMVDDLFNDTEIIPFNIFISERQIFEIVCSLLFEFCFEMLNTYPEGLLYDNNGNLRTRTIDFFAERILHIIYRNIRYFLPGVELQHVQIINIEHDQVKYFL